MKQLMIILFALSSQVAQAGQTNYACQGDAQTYQGANVSQTTVTVQIDWNAKLLTQIVTETRFPPFANAGTVTTKNVFTLDLSTPSVEYSSGCKDSTVHAQSLNQQKPASIQLVDCANSSFSIVATSDDLVCDSSSDRGCVPIQGFQETLCYIGK